MLQVCKVTHCAGCVSANTRLYDSCFSIASCSIKIFLQLTVLYRQKRTMPYSAFPCCKQQKAGRLLGTRLGTWHQTLVSLVYSPCSWASLNKIALFHVGWIMQRIWVVWTADWTGWFCEYMSWWGGGGGGIIVLLFCPCLLRCWRVRTRGRWRWWWRCARWWWTVSWRMCSPWMRMLVRESRQPY